MVARRAVEQPDAADEGGALRERLRAALAADPGVMPTLGESRTNAMRRAGRRVLMMFLAATVLIGPFIGVTMLSLVALFTSSTPAEQLLRDIGPALLMWLAAAAPVTVPGGALGATLAIGVARRKRTAWSRLRWTGTGAFVGAVLAGSLSLVYLGAMGALHVAPHRVPLALLPFSVLGFLVGSIAAWIGYHDLETFRTEQAA